MTFVLPINLGRNTIQPDTNGPVNSLSKGDLGTVSQRPRAGQQENRTHPGCFLSPLEEKAPNLVFLTDEVHLSEKLGTMVSSGLLWCVSSSSERIEMYF